jgi:tetratricopeptide (TPR) repeat protein
MKASHLFCALVALLPLLSWGQASPRSLSRPPPAVRSPTAATPPAAPLSAAAREAVLLAQQGCQSDGYDAEVCERAISRLEAAARENPSQMEVQLALAQAYWNRSFQERADSRQRQNWQQRSKDIYQRLVDRKVGDARPYYELSVRQKDEGQRAALLKRTVELNPRHPRANQDLAWSMLKQGQPDEAWRVYQRHLEVSPVKDRQEAQENLRFAGAMVRAQRPQQAAQVLETVMEQVKDERRAERCLLLESADPRLSEARPTVRRQLQELRPYCTNTEHLDRAVNLEQQGRVDEAVTELERQVDANPKPEETYVMLERLYLRKGQPEKAAEVTARHLRSEPDAREKCERFRRISPHTLRAMDAQTLEATRRQCNEP